MYFIKRITFDDKQMYISSKIVSHTNKSIASAIVLLENSVKDFVKEERGRDATEQSKIIDIHNLDQICEPLIDCILLYRLESDPHKILVYQKRTMIKQVPGWAWGTSEAISKSFYKTDVFELEEYDKISTNVPPPPPMFTEEKQIQVEMVPHGPANVKVPKQLTISPMCNLLSDLKNSPKFKACLQRANTTPIIPRHNNPEKDNI